MGFWRRNTGYGGRTAHGYTAPGSYRVTLTVRDAKGNTASDSTQVAVATALAPSVAPVLLTADALAGEPVEFAALTFEAGARALSYEWLFSDGQSAIDLSLLQYFRQQVFILPPSP